MSSMVKMISIVFILLTICFTVTNGASSCYECNNCGTTWDASKATVIQTSNANDYCRKTVTGTYVTRDSSSSCSPVNVLGHGIFCCQQDLCNSANYRSISMINLVFFIVTSWMAYHFIY